MVLLENNTLVVPELTHVNLADVELQFNVTMEEAILNREWDSYSRVTMTKIRK